MSFGVVSKQKRALLAIMLCSVSIMSFWPTSLLAYGAPGTSTVRGDVVDEDGAILSGVTVELSSGGLVVATTVTNQYGYFVIEDVAFGTYSLRLRKVGYAEVVKSVTFQTESTTFTTVLFRALKLSASTLSIISDPGDQVTIPFTAQNSGEETEVVDFLISSPNGWSAKVTAQSYEVAKVSIAPGQSMSLQLEFTVPLTAPLDRGYNVSITAIGVTTSSLTFTILTRTQPTEALTLSTSVLNMVANPGEKLLLPFVVGNIGESPEIVEFSVSNPNGWSTRILNQDGREIKNAAISSGSTLNLQLEVMVPLASDGANSLTLTAIGRTISTIDFMINVEPASESMLFCMFPGKCAIPGDPVVFQVELTNRFDTETRFKVSVDSVPANWSYSLTTTDNEYVTELILGADESITLVVAVASSSSATTDKNYEFVVKLESVDHSIIDTLPLTVALTEPEAIEEIGISTKFPEVTVEAGEVIQYHITVSNLGDINRLLALSIVPPADWKAVFKSGDIEISRLAIDAGGSEDLIIEVTPPSTVSLDTYDIPVQIKSESGVVFAEIDLKATITGSHKLYLSMSTLLTSTTSGDSASFTATVTNIGFSTLSVVGLEVEAEDGWDVEVSPVQVDLLRPQESFSFDVVIDTPKDTLSGDYLVTLTGLSDQAESSPMQVRVTVNTPTEWGIYGFGLAILIIIVLVLVFRKFKRR